MTLCVLVPVSVMRLFIPRHFYNLLWVKEHKSNSWHDHHHDRGTRRTLDLDEQMQFKSINHVYLVTVFYCYVFTTYLFSAFILSTFVKDSDFFQAFFNHWLGVSAMYLLVCTFLLALCDWETSKKKKKRKVIFSVSSSSTCTGAHTNTHQHTYLHASLQGRPLKCGIAFYYSCCAFCMTQPLVCVYVCKWWKRIKVDNTAASTATLHHRWAQGEDKERKSNRMMAQSHRMNNGLSLLMVQGNSTMAISTRNYHHHSRTWREEKRKRQK